MALYFHNKVPLMRSILFLAKHKGQTLRSSILNLELANYCCDAVAILVGHGLKSGGGEEDVWSVVLLFRRCLWKQPSLDTAPG